MPTARERYLAAVSPKSGDGSPSSVGVSSTVQNFKAAGNAAAAPPAPSPRWASRNGKASRSSTSEMTSPALTPRGPGMLSPRAAALAGSGGKATFKANGHPSPSVNPTPSTSTAAATAAGSKRTEMSPARAAAHAASANRRAPAGNTNNSSSGNNTSSSASGSSSSSRRAVEARLSAARAIYAGAASASAGPVSDDDYFAADGTLDADRVISPATSADDGADANANAVNVMSPTNAVNARLSGAAPPPTLGEIESHIMYLSSDPDSPDSAPVATNRTETKEEEGGQREGKFFDESFEGAFPSVDTSIDGGRSRGNRRNPPSSAERRTNKANRDRDVLHDPFGTMPSLPTPTKASSASSGAAAAPPKQQPPQPKPASTSVAAKRRAKAARSNLTVHTGGHLTSPTAANTHGVSPTSMLDFALLGTPVAAAGYSNDNDEEEAEGEGVLGAAPSPRGWEGGNASGMDINTSRDGLIGSDDLSPSNNNATSMLSDGIDSLERAHASRETEEKKSRFLSKMIMRVSGNCTRVGGFVCH